MTSIEAIKKFFGNVRPVENKELIELKKGIPVEDWKQMGQDCAAALGEQWSEK